MMINIKKSSFTHNEFTEDLTQQAKEIIPYPIVTITEGFKYLGFFSKTKLLCFSRLGMDV